jgi:DNA-binding response OmpR family regulator
MASNQRILIIEDDPLTQEFLAMALTDEAYIIDAVAHDTDAFDRAITFDPQLILLGTG